MVAEYTSGAAAGSGTSYLTQDHLGSTRVVIRGDGTVARYDYLPFGEELGAGVGSRAAGMGYGAADTTRQKFTSKERDTESKLDYFLARYYSSAQGRFTSPDEFTGGPHEAWALGSGDSEKQALPYTDITNPQSLNKYHYCLDNPLRYTDPDGHQNDCRVGIMQEQDIKALLRNKMTPQQFWARRNAEAAGAAIGLIITGGAVLGSQAATAFTLWAARNVDKIEQCAQDLAQASTGNPAPAPRLSAAQIDEAGASIVKIIKETGSVRGTLKSEMERMALGQQDAVEVVKAVE